MKSKSKLILKSFFLILIISSCNSQNEMDLLKLDLSIPDNVLLNEKFQFNSSTTPGILQGYTVYTSEDKNLLSLSGENFNGRFSDKNHNINNIQVYVNDERKDISFFSINIFETKKTELLEKTLNNTFGEPNYYNSDSSVSHSIWEDRSSNNIISLTHKYKGKINGLPVERGTFYKMDTTNEEILTAFSRGPLSFYKEYMDYRKNQAENYTFKMFAEEFDKKGIDKYLKAIQNPIKH